MKQRCIGCGDYATPERSATCWETTPHHDIDVGEDGYPIGTTAPLRETVRVLARDLDLVTKNLTATQTRCNELLLEVRAQRLAAFAWVTQSEWDAAVDKARKRLKEG